jgi:hypothetical protein
MSRWFRFYAEALDDPKVQLLDGDTFKAWVNLLCLAARNGGYLPPIEAVAFALRIDESGALAVVERLLIATLLDKVSGGPSGYRYAPHGWEERQYKSDTSTDRVKRFRQRSKPTEETAPDTEAELETEETPQPPSGGRRGKTVLPSDWQLPPVSELPPKARACAEQWTEASYETEGEGFTLYWRSCGRMMKDWNGTWANRVISRHSSVMRDQKFGNAAPGSPQAVSVDWESRAKFYESVGRKDDAAECRRKAVPIGQAAKQILQRVAQ